MFRIWNIWNPYLLNDVNMEQAITVSNNLIMNKSAVVNRYLNGQDFLL